MPKCLIIPASTPYIYIQPRVYFSIIASGGTIGSVEN